MLSLKSFHISLEAQAHNNYQTSVAVNDQILVGRKGARFTDTQRILFYIGLVIISGLILASVLVKINVNMGYAIDDKQQELVELYQANDHLRLDVAKLKSPSRIQAIATKDLGMDMPKTFIYSSDKAAVVENKAVANEHFKD